MASVEEATAEVGGGDERVREKTSGVSREVKEGVT